MRSTLILWFTVLTLGAFSSAVSAEEIKLEIIPDAWPKQPRVEGYDFNMKNHQGASDFVQKDSQAEPLLKVSKKGRNQFRLIGVRLHNNSDREREFELSSKQFARKKPLRVTVPADDYLTKYFPIRTPKDLRVEVTAQEVKKPTLVEASATLAENGSAFRRAEKLINVGRELDREDWNRRRQKTRPVSVRVQDDLELPVPNARLLFVEKDGLMVHMGRTDDAGRWSGRVRPGAYRVFAFGEVPDRTDRSGNSVVVELPRLLFVEGHLAEDGNELQLGVSRAVRVQVTDVEGRALIPDRVWVTPGPLREAYRYEMVALAIDDQARLESSRTNPGGKFLMLTSLPVPLEIAVETAPADSETIFLRGQLAPRKEAKPEETFDLTFKPELMSRFFVDPRTGPGPGRAARVSLTAIDGMRETMQTHSTALHSWWVPSGDYRIRLEYELFDGSSCHFLPYTTEAKPRGNHDLTPRAPFPATLYYKRKDGSKLQFWLAVRDANGRILSRAPSAGAKIEGTLKNQKYLDQKLDSFRWELASGFGRVDLSKISYKAHVPFGEDPIDGAAKLEGLRVFNAEGSSGNAPGAFEPRMMALLPAVKQSIDSCWQYLGLPHGLRRLNMEFDIFMPPGVGGTGGGGVITLDIANLFTFTSSTDLLPGAYRHELGHNLGFGHDPYMLLMNAGVDEGRFGSFGYRMLNAGAFQHTYTYLERDPRTYNEPWNPSPNVFAALRLLYGPDVHKKMLTLRTAEAKAMSLHNLSTIEQIAALYSLAVEENVAWVFRAHGWPVFDARVDMGATAVTTRIKHPRKLNYNRLDGFAVNNWWVYGPIVGWSLDEANTDIAWRQVEWPTSFIRLDEDRPPNKDQQRYVLFRRVVAPKDMEVHLVCASDTALEIRLNGSPISSLEASPQYSQPVHDEHMLNQKKPNTVQLFKGENFLEVAAIQPAGSKGFVLEFLDAKGRAPKLKLAAQGPGGELEPAVVKLGKRNAIYNPSFQHGLTGWIGGPTEPSGGLDMGTTGSAGGDGTVLRVGCSTAARGGLIQRVAVEPGKKYRLSANIRTERFKGKAFVSFFQNEFHTQAGKTEPVMLENTNWKQYQANWFSGTSRVIYVACYVHGSSGTVYFDDLKLEQVR